MNSKIPIRITEQIRITHLLSNFLSAVVETIDRVVIKSLPAMFFLQFIFSTYLYYLVFIFVHTPTFEVI